MHPVVSDLGEIYHDCTSFHCHVIINMCCIISLGSRPSPLRVSPFLLRALIVRPCGGGKL